MAKDFIDHDASQGQTQQFERHLSENSMEYMIFVLDDSLEGIQYLSRLENISKEATRLMNSVAKDYIWQRDEFQLSVVNDQGLIYLHGTTDYGDAVEDEWLIVYVLRELSKSHPELFIRVADEDGEFLLVEAANTLPSWLNPEIDRCRVWIQDGKLKIIPLPSDKTKPDATKSLTLTGAVNCLRNKSENLIHSTSIEDEAFYRLENVKFSRVLFAQLRSQRFETPKRWQNTIKAQIEGENKDGAKISNILAFEDGMKLTCGYEMLALTAEKSNHRAVREFGIMLEDLKEDGDEELPSNKNIETWLHVKRNDDESWLDINYVDFERELEGQGAKPHASHLHSSGFGDSRTQDNLRKIVSRFEAFLNDETAGLDGAEVNGTDMDNDEYDCMDEDDEDSDDESGDLEDSEVSFDEYAFSRMMKEMVGLPVDNRSLPATVRRKGKAAAERTNVQDIGTEDQAIKNLSLQMEAELKSHGALHLEDSKRQQGKRDHENRSRDDIKAMNKHNVAEEEDRKNDDEDSDKEVDIDYNLAKNLLESFKSQVGTAGPTGNLLGLMGFQLPRDEDDSDKEE
ncbi:hypothetical protein V2A60_007946 [Cordyceps javanica]|uniref:SGT1 domain-containing protein n=1 Tax=Cordyceps javanica TaxID=43265 RepID=A0A545V9L5_9HYPO|nr:SGT1 domain-containing protein [Cordyceps javanica]TQW09519.1 SGT1 domain containing protein [Cordyceps javanica]